MVAVGVLLGSALLGWFRWQHESWVPAPYAAVIAVLVISVALLILGRAKTVQDRRAGDILLWSGLAPLAVAAAAAPPGPVGAPHAVMGFAVAGVGAMMAMRFTGRRLGTGTAIVTICLAATIASLARMAFGTGAVTLLGCILLACVFGYHGAPALSRWLSGIRLPVFPSATSRWVFEARPDLPTTVVHPVGGGRPTLEGPASVQDVVLRAERARSFLTGLLVGLGVLTIVSLTGVSDPRTPDRWLPLLLAAATAGFLMLRGRSYVDRWQAIILAVTSVLIVAAIVVRYTLTLSSAASISAGVRPGGAAACGRTGSCGDGTEHHLQPAVPQARGMGRVPLPDADLPVGLVVDERLCSDSLPVAVNCGRSARPQWLPRRSSSPQ